MKRVATPLLRLWHIETDSNAEIRRGSSGERSNHMRIVLRSLVMITGGLLLVGMVGLGLLNLVLDVWPLRTAPATEEDVARWRKFMADTPDSASTSGPKTHGPHDHTRA